MLYKENDVFQEALDRIRFVYDNCEDVMVAMSGGKDSTVVFNLALIVARERNRLPLKVFWIDQEAEWQGTVDYMNKIMHLPYVKPYWCQFPFDFTNSLSHDKNFVRVWDPEAKDRWVHPQSDISIKVNPTTANRFHDLERALPNVFAEPGKELGLLVGLRTQESIGRRVGILHVPSRYKGITWCTQKWGNFRKFWPIYDFTADDVWTAIAKNHWEYNRIYDLQYQYGVPRNYMRVSALIHETAWHAIEMLQEFEPKTYNRFCARIEGVSTFNHSFDEGDIIPKELPFAFKDWKEYRDYLLVNLVKPEYWELFRNRWKNQTGEWWYRVHVHEVIINDIDGTINANGAKAQNLAKKKAADKYHKANVAEFKKYEAKKKEEVK